MTIRLSTACANFLLGSFAANYQSGIVSIRTGTPPANADAVATGTELAAVTLGVWNAAVAGTITTTAPSVMAAVATGVAGWARLTDPMQTCAIDGTVGVAGSGADFIVNAVSITNGANVTVSAITLTLPLS